MCILCQYANNREVLDELICVECNECPNIEHVPDLPRLQRLNAEGCSMLKTIGHLPQVKHIYCEGCPRLTTIADTRSVRYLYCHNNTFLTTAPRNEGMNLGSIGCLFLYAGSSPHHICHRGVRDWTQRARNSLMVKRRRALVHRILTEQDSLLNDLVRIVLGYVSRLG